MSEAVINKIEVRNVFKVFGKREKEALAMIKENGVTGGGLPAYGTAVLVNIVNNGKHNEMPAQKEKLTEAQIAVLASYVWSLSNTQDAK